MANDSPAFHPARSLGYWVKRMGVTIQMALEERTSTLGLSATESILLMILHTTGSKSLVEISTFMVMTHPSALRHIDSLEERGLIVRNPHPSDRRIKLVELTQPGRELIQDIQKIIEELNDQAMGHLDQEGRDTLLGNLRQAILNLTDESCLPIFPDMDTTFNDVNVPTHPHASDEATDTGKEDNS